MDKDSKSEALKMLEDIMKLSLHYCKDNDDEIASYSVRVNNLSHDVSKLIKRNWK